MANKKSVNMSFPKGSTMWTRIENLVYYPGEQYSEWYDKIYFSLFRSVERYGKDARCLSEKQLDILCREVANHWTMCAMIKEASEMEP